MEKWESLYIFLEVTLKGEVANEFDRASLAQPRDMSMD